MAVSNHIDGKNIAPLKAIYFYPTKYCNLKCRHCWISPPFKKSLDVLEQEAMTFEETKAVFKEAVELGVTTVKLTGGEPLLYPYIDDLLDYLNKMKLTLQLETNGTLISLERAKLIGEISRQNKNTFISVSIDGERESHDLQRGVQGAFDQSLEGMQLLALQGVACQLIMAIEKRNVKDFEKVLKKASELKVCSVKVNVINDISRGEKLQKEGSLLTTREILAFQEKIRHLNENGSFPFPILTNLPPAFKNIHGIKNSGRCAIHHILGLLWDGSVSLCGIGSVDQKYIVGNVLSSSLKQLWEEGALFQQIRCEVPKLLKGVCGMCKLKALCKGECRADALYKHGDCLAPFELCQRAFDEGLFPQRWIYSKES